LKHFAEEEYHEQLKPQFEKEISDEKNLAILAFNLYDLNRDGFLDGHELRAVFVNEAHTPSSETYENLIDHVLEEDDYDNDGKISFPEYYHSQLR
jgi:Ca2+-binding EF-hand superfamily protein